MVAVLCAGDDLVASDLFTALVFAVGFFGARFCLDNLFFKRWARRLLTNGVAKVVIDDAKKSKIVKCSESMWKFTYYASVELWVFLILQKAPWSTNTDQYFRGWPNQDLSCSLKLYNMCQCGFYLFSIVALVTWETRRKDFYITMAHHIISSFLIGFSLFTRFFRIGTVVLALHDVADVIMEASKVFKYSEKEMAASIGFLLFAVSWFIFRLIIFPFRIIKASSYESIEHWKMLNIPVGFYYIFNTLLLTLLVFHIYWWKLICGMIIRQVRNRGQVGDDIRSDSEDD